MARFLRECVLAMLLKGSLPKSAVWKVILSSILSSILEVDNLSREHILLSIEINAQVVHSGVLTIWEGSFHFFSIKNPFPDVSEHREGDGHGFRDCDFENLHRDF
jgi:hypothetical protein